MSRFRAIEPDNRELTTLTGPNFVPSQPIIDNLLAELTAAERRAAGPRPGREEERSGAESGDPATEVQRANLRRAMINAGLLRPDDTREAHHIVPGGRPMSGGRDATEEQRRLSALGIGLDSAQNGAPLSPGFHRPLHTRDYYNYVQTRLGEARNAGQARAILDEMRLELTRRDELYQRTGELPPWR